MLAEARESLEAYLFEFEYFAPLDENDIRYLTAQAVFRQFKAREIIFIESEPCAGLWMIATGSVRIFKVNAKGDEYFLHLLGPGDYFNDIPILDGGPNPASAAALSDASLWHIPSDALSYLLETNAALTRHVMGILARRVRMLVGRIEDLALRSVTARVAGFLMHQSRNPSLDGPGVTRAAIAAHLATTPETISRVLRQLEAARVIQFDRHRIIILDADQLAELSLL